MQKQIDRILRECGLTEYGLCPFAPLQAHLLPCRAANRLPQNPSAVIVCLFPYRFDSDAPRNLSRYACVPDYHRVAGDVLLKAATMLQEATGALFVPFVDNSPIPEVYAAALAGLGCIGDNGLLIHPRFGSYVFIGTIVTDAPIDTVASAIARCGVCGTCKSACPTGALSNEHIDAARCLSAVSQRKGELTKEEAQALKQNGLLWGCDRCQEVCPHNRDAVCAPFCGFDSYEPWLFEVPPKEVLDTKPYGWRGASVLLRNQRIVCGEDEY